MVPYALALIAETPDGAGTAHEFPAGTRPQASKKKSPKGLCPSRRQGCAAKPPHRGVSPIFLCLRLRADWVIPLPTVCPCLCYDLRLEMASRGLRARTGQPLALDALSRLLHNPFYIGLIRIARTQEMFEGVHQPLVSKRIFDRVQVIMEGRFIRVPPVGTPPLRSADVPKSQTTGFDDGVFRPRRFDASALRPVQLEEESRPRARSNFDSMIRPMTLQTGFPGFAEAIGGSIVNAADQILEVTGPARDATMELTKNASNVLIDQIMKVDPHYRFDSLGFPETIDGMNNQLDQLHRDRAAAFYRTRREVRPLQAETLRYLQSRVNKAYEEGVSLLRTGKLNVRLSPNEALGNYIDGRARRDLRTLYQWMGISIERGEPVQVNRRHFDTRENDSTYRIPDARIGKVAFDVTLTRKTLASPQVRGFFNTDAEPEMVIIVRPRQLGPHHTYAIKSPGR